MITYQNNVSITATQFIDVLQKSGLSARRPVGDIKRIQTMLDHANVLVTAWDDSKLVGVSRALTDQAYCCYLSDLAVDKAYQGKGIGKRLIELTHEVSGGLTTTSLILLSAPDAFSYYEHLGLNKIDNGFIIKRST